MATSIMSSTHHHSELNNLITIGSAVFIGAELCKIRELFSRYVYHSEESVSKNISTSSQEVSERLILSALVCLGLTEFEIKLLNYIHGDSHTPIAIAFGVAEGYFAQYTFHKLLGI